MLERSQRELNDSERESLLAQHHDAARRLRRMRLFFASLAVITVVVGTPLGLSQLRQDQALGMLAAATVVAFLGAYLWAYRSMIGGVQRHVDQLRDAAENGTAHILHCEAARYVAVFEIEDEGVEVFLDIGPAETLYLGGQHYYDIPSFPSSAMDMIEIRSSNGDVADFQVVCQGEPLEPLRTITEDEKLALLEVERYPPEDGDVLPCALDDVEKYLGGS